MTLEEAYIKADDLADKLGMPIDKKIKSLVVGLWVNGIDTTGSCEGHTKWGESFPWVDIETEEPNGWKESRYKRMKWKAVNDKQARKFKRLLSAYRKSISAPYDFVMWERGSYGAVRLEVKDKSNDLSKGSLIKLQKQADDLGQYLIEIYKRTQPNK